MGTKWTDSSVISRILGFLAILSGAVMNLTTPTPATSTFDGPVAPFFANASASQGEGWKMPDAPRILAAADLEVTHAQRILSLDNIRSSAAFQNYLDALDAALPEQTTTFTVAVVQQMTLGLAVARATLEGSISNASQWLALFRAANPAHIGPIQVPARFIQREVASAEPILHFDVHAIAMRRAVLSLSGSSDADSPSTDSEFASPTG